MPRLQHFLLCPAWFVLKIHWKPDGESVVYRKTLSWRCFWNPPFISNCSELYHVNFFNSSYLVSYMFPILHADFCSTCLWKALKKKENMFFPLFSFSNPYNVCVGPMVTFHSFFSFGPFQSPVFQFTNLLFCLILYSPVGDFIFGCSSLEPSDLLLFFFFCFYFLIEILIFHVHNSCLSSWALFLVSCAVIIRPGHFLRSVSTGLSSSFVWSASACLSMSLQRGASRKKATPSLIST